jgi:hypothetical protein
MGKDQDKGTVKSSKSPLAARFRNPVEARARQIGDTRRHAHIKRIVRATRLEQQHLDLGLGRQPVGEDRARRTRSDDDVIVWFCERLPMKAAAFINRKDVGCGYRKNGAVASGVDC